MKTVSQYPIASSILLFISLIAIIITSQLIRFNNQNEDDEFASFPETYPTDSGYLAVEITVQSVDTANGKLILQLDFFPEGDLIDENGLLTKNLALDFTDVVAGNIESEFQKGAFILNTQTVSLNLQGQTSEYPLDEHKSLIRLFLAEKIEENEETRYAPVPLVVELYSDIAGYSLEYVQLGADDERNGPELGVYLDVLVQHSSTNFSFILFLMGFQWLLGFIAFIVVVIVLTKRLEVTIANFGWMSALLFAQISLRNAMPNTPPIGTIGDSMSFFWVLGIIVVSMLILVSTWVAQTVKDDE